MKDMTGGVDKEIYRVYARMLELNDTCEKFVAASAGRGKNAGAAETVLSAELEAPSLEQSVLLSH
jgi:hypothetical protein